MWTTSPDKETTLQDPSSPGDGWCQRWRDRRNDPRQPRQHSFRHRSEGGFDSRRYDVAHLGEEFARAFIEANHYSGTYPAAVHRFGLYDGPFLVGVAVLSVPTQRAVLTNVFPDLEPYGESLELGRFVLADAVPANGESWFLARCWELAAVADVRGVVAFSDPEPRSTSDGRIVFPGHLGIIYQASNATYHGRSTPRTIQLLPDGTVLSARAIQKIRAGEQGQAYASRILVAHGARPRRKGEDVDQWLGVALRQAGVRSVRHRGNHRYAFTIGPRRKWIALGQPIKDYPKAA